MRTWKTTDLATLLSLLAFLLVQFFVPSSAFALPAPLDGLVLGCSLASARATLEARSDISNLVVHESNQPQGLSSGLIGSGLLEVLNRRKASHTLLTSPGERQVGFVTLELGEVKVTLGFAEDQLEAAMFVFPAKVDREVGGTTNVFDARRLHGVQAAIRRSGNGCRFRRTAEDGTADFRWEGNCGAAQSYLEYRPFDESVVLLIVR